MVRIQEEEALQFALLRDTMLLAKAAEHVMKISPDKMHNDLAVNELRSLLKVLTG
jgi:hypothetical protein